MAFVQTHLVEHPPDMSNVDRLAAMASAGHSQLLGPQCSTGLLRNRSLEWLRRRTEEEAASRFAKRSDDTVGGGGND